MRSRMQIIATSAAIGAVVVSLGACSRGDGAAASGSGHATAASGSKSAVMIMSTLNNPFFVSVKNGAAAEAPKKGIKLDVENANNSDSTALNLATSALAKQPGILIIDPVGSQSATASVTAANSANVPVMAFDRKPEGGNLATFVGYDAIQAGRNAADALAKGLGDKGTIVEIQGILGTNVAQDRSKGFEEEMAAKHPNIKTVAKQAADFDRAKALDVMTNILQAHPDINGVYAANDEMAMGVLAALKSRSLDGKVVLVGNDGISDALAAVAAGTMYATNAESPFALGQKVADLAADVIGGKSVEKNTTLEGQLVTKDNVKDYAQHLVSIGDAADAPANLK
jgi:ribose transport system substrate-binding protein